ncbi:MAG: zinc-ribbon domain-containing protein [Naasia sp.]
MRCAHCGADLPEGAMFCGECGQGVHAQVVTADDHAAGAGEVPSTGAAPEENVTRVVEQPADRPTSGQSDSREIVLDEATRLPERRSLRTRFTLHFSTGETVTVEGSGLIGRRPTAQPGEYFDEYIVVDDPGRSVSKTHLEFGQDGGAFWISDRFSANGTVVREPDRAPRLCPGGTRSRIARGSRVDIGEQFFLVA